MDLWSLLKSNYYVDHSKKTQEPFLLKKDVFKSADHLN